MSRAERLLDLMQVLGGHRRPVAGAVLAAELGVSLRTIYRDVETLKAQGAHIEGVVDMRSHDGRYLFATALGLDGTSYEQLGVLLHHSPGSAMPMRYDLSAAITAAAAQRFNERMKPAVEDLSRHG